MAETKKVISETGVTLTRGDCFWSPVHNQGLYVVDATQTALYVCGLPDQPEEAEGEKPRFAPGEPRPRAVSKFLSGECWKREELTAVNQAFAENYAAIRARVGKSGEAQPLPGQERLVREESEMAKKAKAAKTPKAAGATTSKPAGEKKTRGNRPPASAMLAKTSKEAAEKDEARGGVLYGHAGRIMKALKGCSNGRGSCETVAKHLAADKEHESKTDALTLVRYFAPKLAAAGYLTIEAEG